MQLWITFQASGYSISTFQAQMQWVTMAKVSNNIEGKRRQGEKEERSVGEW